MSIVEAWTPKEISRRPATHYDARLVRRVDAEHNDLAATIEAVQSATRDFTDFMPIGKLSVTLCDLSPVVRHVLNADKKGNIQEYAKQDFEQEIIEAIDTDGQKIVAPEQGDYSFGLYGRWQNMLGIRLMAPSPLLIGERYIAERYIKDTYSTSPRFASEDLMDWEPHVTLGQIRYEALSPVQRSALQSNTSGFISAVVENPERLADPEYAPVYWSDPIEIPDIALGGLRVVCDKKPNGIF